MFPADGIRMVEISTERGRILVAGADRMTVQAELVDDVDSPKKCAVTMRADHEARVIRLSVKSLGLFKSGDCKTGFKIELPKRLAVRAASGAGTIDVSDLDGALSVENGTGDIRLSAVRGKIKATTGTGSITGTVPADKSASLETGTGEIKLKGLAGPVEARSGTGELRLEWAKAPAKDFKGRSRLNIGTGNATAYFPEGSVIKTELRSGLGSTINEIGDTPDAGFVVAMESGTGRAAVLKVKTSQRGTR